VNEQASDERTVWSGLAVLVRAFAGRAQNWLALARNLIPVAGVYLLGWSKNLTVFGYWFEGLCMVAIIVITLSIRVPEEKFRSAPWRQVPFFVLVTLLCGAFALFMVGIPYWMAYGALGLDVAFAEIRRTHAEISFLGMAAALVVKAFLHGGYLTLGNDELRERWQPDLHNLGGRALAMLAIAGWSLGYLLVPLIALLLTGIEVWPAMRRDLDL